MIFLCFQFPRCFAFKNPAYVKNLASPPPPQSLRSILYTWRRDIYSVSVFFFFWCITYTHIQSGSLSGAHRTYYNNIITIIHAPSAFILYVI